MKIRKGKTEVLGHCLNCHRRNDDGSNAYPEVYEIELGKEDGGCLSSFRLCPECFKELIFIGIIQLKP